MLDYSEVRRDQRKVLLENILETEDSVQLDLDLNANEVITLNEVLAILFHAYCSGGDFSANRSTL